MYTKESGYVPPKKENDYQFNFYFKMANIDYLNLQRLLNVIPNQKPAWSESKKRQAIRKKATIKRIISDQTLRDLLKELQFIGDIGEIIAYSFEVDRLKSIGLSKYAELIEHTSIEKGHGFGFDIKSFDYTPDGTAVEEIFIEVKTTKKGENQVFSMTKNEYNFLKQYKESYRIYRVFDIYDNENSVVIHKFPFEKFEILKETSERYLFKLSSSVL